MSAYPRVRVRQPIERSITPSSRVHFQWERISHTQNCPAVSLTM